MSYYRSLAFVAIASLLAPALGCGDGRVSLVPVSGKVLIDGQPLTKGSVRFVPPNSRPSGGVLDAEGRFVLSCYEDGDGVVTGSHQVEVVANERVSPSKMRWFAPKKYANIATSGLKQEVTGPTDSVVINISWEGGKPYIEVDGVGGDDLGSGDMGIR